MAFTVTTQKCSDRRTKLRRAQQLLNELININDTADRTRAQLIANSVADPADTVNKILAGGGPPFVTGATDITPVGDTVADELILILSTSAGGIGWEYLAE
jgi:hypothetical protein